jgi:predicted nuclease with TOPRIM domain
MKMPNEHNVEELQRRVVKLAIENSQLVEALKRIKATHTRWKYGYLDDHGAIAEMEEHAVYGLPENNQ